VGVLIDAAGLSAHVDASDLNRVGPQACGPLNTFLKFRQSPSMGAIALPRGDFSFHDRPSGCDPAAGMQAKTMAVITVPPASDFTLVGMEPSGRLQQVLADRADFEAHIKSNPTLFASERGSFLSYLCVDERTGAATPLIIEVLVQGQGPFNFTPLNTDQSDASAVDADWQDRFWANARVNGWKTEIAWFRVHK
jgi:serine/threonine-protein kinase